MSSILNRSVSITNTAFLGILALSSLWYCYIRQVDLCIRRREVRMNVLTTTLTLTAGVIGSYLSARTRRDSIAHAMVVNGVAAAQQQQVHPPRRRRPPE